MNMLTTLKHKLQQEISIQNSEYQRLNSNSEFWKWTVWETESPSDLHSTKFTYNKKSEKPVNNAVLDFKESWWYMMNVFQMLLVE